MTGIWAALLPVAAIILAGLLLRRSGFIAEPGWRDLERLVYYLLFPALLFSELARADLGSFPLVGIVVALTVVQFTMAGLAILLRRALGLPGPVYTSLAQGLVRFNSYVAIAVSPLLFGRAAGPAMAVAVAVMVPLANFLSVAALARHGSAAGQGLRGFLRALAGNPLILACLAGAACSIADLELPAVVGETLGVLGRAALALGLLTVGAGLQPLRLQVHGRTLTAALLARLIVSPLLGLLLGLLLGAGLGSPDLGVIVLACGVPTASTSYILARLMGGDAELMAAIISVQTACALLTLPLVLALAGF